MEDSFARSHCLCGRQHATSRTAWGQMHCNIDAVWLAGGGLKGGSDARVFHIHGGENKKWKRAHLLLVEVVRMVALYGAVSLPSPLMVQ
eukprot:487675-Pleurochrysis_carterae.AAC.3